MKRKTVLCLLALFVLFAGYCTIYVPAFSHDTLWNRGEALQEYLDHQHGQDRSVTILKTTEKDRIMGVIYQDEEKLYVAFFTKLLFGTRWKYDGMDMVGGDTVFLSGKWHQEPSGSSCDVEIVGDNRKGRVGSYLVAGNEDIARENLEQDFILDIYIMDGIEELPNRNLLQQYTPDGQLIER